MKTINETEDLITDEVLEDIHSSIKGYEGSYFENMFFDLFNASYYIIGTYQAKEWLENVGSLNCVQIITDWENEHFGEVQFKEFNNFEKLASLAVYAVADELYQNMLNDLDFEQDDEITEDHIEAIQDYIAEGC